MGDIREMLLVAVQHPPPAENTHCIQGMQRRFFDGANAKTSV